MSYTTFVYFVSFPLNPPSSDLTRMFSLLQPTNFPHEGQFTVLPASILVSSEFMSPKKIGDGNQVLQLVHWISRVFTLDMYFTSFKNTYFDFW